MKKNYFLICLLFFSARLVYGSAPLLPDSRFHEFDNLLAYSSGVSCADRRKGDDPIKVFKAALENVRAYSKKPLAQLYMLGVIYTLNISPTEETPDGKTLKRLLNERFAAMPGEPISSELLRRKIKTYNEIVSKFS
jgi:hypothetical protein